VQSQVGDQQGSASIVIDPDAPPKPERPPGDVDGDGIVDGRDLSLFGSSIGKSPGDPGFDPDADFDGNGAVDQADAHVLVANLLSE
jgi:hypothetical protein